MKVTKEMVENWLGHNFMNGNSSDCQEWLPDLIGRLANKEVTVKEIVEEIQGMYKDYMLDKENEDDR